jgi:hypothetical protein
VLSSRPEYFDAGLVVAFEQPIELAGDDAADRDGSGAALLPAMTLQRLPEQ